jgi:hypothetical protein
MKEANEKQMNFSRTNWEIATTIVGAQLLMGIDAGEMNLEQVQKEIIQDVFFSNLLDSIHEKIDSEVCDEEDIEVYKSIGLNTIVIQAMLDYTSIIQDSPIELESIHEIDLPLDEKGVDDFVAKMSFSSEEEKQISALFYSETNSMAHELINNESVMKIIVAIYNLLNSDIEMKQKHLLIHKTLVELKFINFN